MKRTLLVGAIAAIGSASAQVFTPPPVDFPPDTQIRPYGVPPKKAGPAPGPEGRVATFEELQRARNAFEELIRAYETANVGLIEQRLDPRLIGYQLFLDGLRRNISAQRNLRIQLLDVQVTGGPDLTVIETSWEKRFLDASTFQPALITGRSTVLMSRSNEQWQLAAVAGDNLFADGAGTLAQMTITPETVLSTAGGCAAAACPPIRLEIVDADLAAQPFIQAEALSTDGDRETLLLNRIGPGRFAANVAIEIGTAFVPIPNNGALTLRAAGGTQTQFVVRFFDTTPGSNRPPSLLAKNVRVQVPPGPPPAGGGSGGGGTLATLSVLPGAVALSFVACATTTTAPIQVTVTEPDLAAAPSVAIVATTPDGDFQTLTLPAIAPGIFRVSTLPFSLKPVVNDGFISAGGLSATFRYLDTTVAGAPKPVPVIGTLSITFTVTCSAGVP